jgi:hypothetical protein
MRAREFRDDDNGYRTWLDTHTDGYVLNIARSHNPADARVHLATCTTINGQNPPGRPSTGPYVKVCARQLAELELWATDHASALPSVCGTCHRPPPAVLTAPSCRW